MLAVDRILSNLCVTSSHSHCQSCYQQPEQVPGVDGAIIRSGSDFRDTELLDCGTDNPFVDQNGELDVDNTLVSVVKSLLTEYSDKMDLDGQDPGNLVYAGGLQQYLIRKAKEAKQHFHIEQPRRTAGTSDATTFHDLPDSIQLHIFSFLDARTICYIARVCRHWLMLTSDDLSWEQRLSLDEQHWSQIGHTSHPDIHKETQPDWSHQEIYLRSSPEVSQLIRQQNTSFHQLSNLFRAILPRKTPKLAMFGPGLESSTSGLARIIIEQKSDLLKTVGMFPGGAEGVGSGFTMKMSSARHSSLTFNLSILYTAPRAERQKFKPEERARFNKMLAHNAGPAEGEEDEDEVHELRPAIRDLCKTVDAFVFVVDASESVDTVRRGRMELVSMVQEEYVSPSVPVLVLSCVPEASDAGSLQTARRVPCIEVARALQLHKLNRPWQVHDCTVQGLVGICPALEWVIELTQRR